MSGSRPLDPRLIQKSVDFVSAYLSTSEIERRGSRLTGYGVHLFSLDVPCALCWDAISV
jgi:hypothetical protein